MPGLVKKAKGLQRFMLDCGFWRSRKWTGASLAAVGLQTCAVSYCYEHGTDGHLPADAGDLAVALGVREKDVRKTLPEMIRRGVWRATDEGHEIIGFLDHNPSQHDIDEYRDKRQRAGIKANHERWHTDRFDESCPHCVPDPPPIQIGHLNGSESDPTTESQSRVEEAEQASPPTPPTSSDAIGPAPPGKPAAGAPPAEGIVEAALRLLAIEAVDARTDKPRDREACIRSQIPVVRAEHQAALVVVAAEHPGETNARALIELRRIRLQAERDLASARSYGESMALDADLDWDAISDEIGRRYPAGPLLAAATAAAESIFRLRISA